MVLVSSVVESADGRFSGSTSNEGSFMSASTIDLELGAAASHPNQPGSDASDLALDVENLLPGMQVERCIQINYAGSVDDARVRLLGRVDAPGGLEQYLDTRIIAGRGGDADCSDFVAANDQPLFSGSFSEFAQAHGDFDSGVPVGDPMADGDSLTLRLSVEIRDDNRAQGLTSSFWLVFEVRP